MQYAKLQLGWQVSNLRHAGYKPAALPLSYIPQPSPGRLAALFIVLCATLCGYLSFLSCYRQPTRCSFFPQTVVGDFKVFTDYSFGIR